MADYGDYDDFDLDTMALTVFGEARGEPIPGQRAVASVIRNRWKNPRWWSRNACDGIPDDTVAAVCRDPWQFSCWNPSDPQRKLLDDPDTLHLPSFQRIRNLCDQVLDGKLADNTNGADHYCTVAIIPHTRWARMRKPVAIIGNHAFFRIELSKP